MVNLKLVNVKIISKFEATLGVICKSDKIILDNNLLFITIQSAESTTVVQF